MLAAQFGPKLLKQVRQAMVDDRVVRVSLNRHVGRIRRMFKWGVAEEYVPTTVWTALQSVSGLQRGRTIAVESVAVRPVDEVHIEAIRAYVSRQVWGMIELQTLTGARPGEIVLIRGCDLNMTGPIWEFVPESHKTEHHGRRRVIFIGPRGQTILQEILQSDLQAYLFSPREARDDFDAKRRLRSQTQRHTPRVAPEVRRQWRPGEHYNEHSYRTAIHRACDRAGVPRWNPNQLRHNAATFLRREFGIEAARTILGHASAVTTEIYAEIDHDKARAIIGRVG
ncbi:MAG: site-specific integrase [Planctomycetaceae bacterium]|nr:site-specific integrase [Planctomycetaceae bacterium]